MPPSFRARATLGCQENVTQIGEHGGKNAANKSHSFVDVAPILAAAGYRVLVPYLRGYGETRFLSAATPRNAQPAAVAADAISFMDALKIDKAVMGGFDWGGRNANLLSFLRAAHL
jgi:pimeloyl-ACP methyl ester carboxylesterase